MNNKVKIGIVAAVVIILIITIVGCSKANNNNNRQTEYREVWTTHYQNGRYDPYYDYGLGSRYENGRKIYVVPAQPPKTVINNYNNAPQTKAPTTTVKPTTTTKAPAPTTNKPSLKIETSKPQAPKVNTAKPPAPKPAAPKPPAPKPAPKPAR